MSKRNTNSYEGNTNDSKFRSTSGNLRMGLFLEEASKSCSYPDKRTVFK